MDFLENGFKLFSYVIILTLVRFIVPKLLGGIKYEKDEMGRTHFNYKRVSYFFFAAAIFFTVPLILFNIFPSNVTGERKVYLNIGMIVFCLIWYIFSLMYSLWYIHLEPDKIICRNLFGRRTILELNDISTFERNANGTLSIKSNNKEDVIFEREYADVIILWLCEKKIKPDYSKKADVFVIRPAKYMRILSICCETVFVSGFVLGLVTNVISVIVGFFFFSIFGIWNCCIHYSEKYMIGNGRIEKSDMFSKKKIVTYTEIYNADIEYGDNVSYISLYKKGIKKPFLKVNRYYENAFLLEELAVKKNWLK